MAVVEVTFQWTDEHGECTGCGLPAGFLNSIDQKLCAVCAANGASRGESIRRIDDE